MKTKTFKPSERQRHAIKLMMIAREKGQTVFIPADHVQETITATVVSNNLFAKKTEAIGTGTFAAGMKGHTFVLTDAGIAYCRSEWGYRFKAEDERNAAAKQAAEADVK